MRGIVTDEPPDTYLTAMQNNLQLIDASCPIVLRLQMQIRNYYEKYKSVNGQIAIYGKANHAEVIALNAHANNEAIIIQGKEDLNKIDYNRPLALFSQTTKNSSFYHEIADIIRQRMKNENFFVRDSVCNQVANRHKYLYDFCKDKDLVIFISGKKSSNGKMLYEICKSANKNCNFVSELKEIKSEWLNNVEHVGISGATSTPSWLIKQVYNLVLEMSR